MKENFNEVMDDLFRSEGGYVDNPRDNGGPTNLGITQRTLSRWRKRPVSKQEVRDLKPDEAKAIYKAWYWDRVRADILPSGLDYAMYDFCVNSGHDRPIRFLQKALGIIQDGKFGPKTEAAVKAADTKKTIEKLCALRLSWLHGHEDWDVFGKGWTNRVNKVVKDAVAMIKTKTKSSHVESKGTKK